MDTFDCELHSTKPQPGSFSLLTCLFSLAGLVLLLYVVMYRPIFAFRAGEVSPWWEIGYFSGGCLLILGLLFGALSLWRQEAETNFKTFGLFLNFVAMFLICAATICWCFPQ